MAEIDLKSIIQSLLRRWWIILISLVVCSGAAIFWSYYYLVPIYEANTTLYVGKNVEHNGQIATSDLYLGTALISDYREIARSRLVAYAVIKELGFSNISADYIISKIGVSQKGETRVIQISARDANPKFAMDLANKVAEVFQKQVVEIMKVEIVMILDKAELPRWPISPNKKKNVMMGFILGLGLGVGVVLLIEFLDNTIKTPEDVAKYVDLPVIGTIPVFPGKGK